MQAEPTRRMQTLHSDSSQVRTLLGIQHHIKRGGGGQQSLYDIPQRVRTNRLEDERFNQQQKPIFIIQRDSRERSQDKI